MNVEADKPPTLHYASVHTRPRLPVVTLAFLFGIASLLGGAGWSALYTQVLHPVRDESFQILLGCTAILAVWGVLSYGISLWLFRRSSSPAPMRLLAACIFGIVYAMIPSLCFLISDSSRVHCDSTLCEALLFSVIGGIPPTAAALTTSRRLGTRPLSP